MRIANLVDEGAENLSKDDYIKKLQADMNNWRENMELGHPLRSLCNHSHPCQKGIKLQHASFSNEGYPILF